MIVAKIVRSASFGLYAETVARKNVPINKNTPKTTDDLQNGVNAGITSIEHGLPSVQKFTVEDSRLVLEGYRNSIDKPE